MPTLRASLLCEGGAGNAGVGGEPAGRRHGRLNSHLEGRSLFQVSKSSNNIVHTYYKYTF